MLTTSRKPIILSDLQELNREYLILLKRKEHLQEAMNAPVSVPASLEMLRRAELTRINSYLSQVEHFYDDIAYRME